MSIPLLGRLEVGHAEVAERGEERQVLLAPVNTRIPLISPTADRL